MFDMYALVWSLEHAIDTEVNHGIWGLYKRDALTSPRVIAYSAIGACVESGVKIMTASPGERASIAVLSGKQYD